MAKFNFRRGEAVIQYARGKALKYYWGGKMGGYRVLSAQATHLDSGACIPEKEVGVSIFPAPNEFGIYDERHARKISYRSTSGRDSATVYVLQIGPDLWAHAASWVISTGGYGGSSHGLSRADAEPSEAQAAARGIVGVLLGLRAHVLRQPGNEKAKGAVKKAMTALLSQASPSERDNIDMLLRDA